MNIIPTEPERISKKVVIIAIIILIAIISLLGSAYFIGGKSLTLQALALLSISASGGIIIYIVGAIEWKDWLWIFREI